MQNERNNRVNGRIPNLINRGCVTKPSKNVDIDRRKQDGTVGRPVRTGIIGLPEEGKNKPIRNVRNVNNIPTKLRGNGTRTDDNRVSQSIRKLLSEFERGQKNNIAKSRIPEMKPRPKVIRMDKTTGRRLIPVLSDKVKEYSVDIKQLPEKVGEFNDQKILQKKLGDNLTEAEKPPTEEVNLTGFLDENLINDVTSSNDQLIPIMTPERRIEKPPVIRENPENRPLNFLLGGSSGSVFPVCSKRATNDIPSLEKTTLVQDSLIPSNSDLIVMLRRRNSEPSPPRNSRLQQHSSETENPLNWNLKAVENYYFWESATTKPYWEVSLFKSNRSLSVLTSRVTSGMLPLTQTLDSAEMLQPVRFETRRKIEDSQPWIREITSVSDDKMATLPFITLMEKGRIIPREPQLEKEYAKTRKERSRPPKSLSKDDHYKPPGRLLVYVKSSQRKLVKIDDKSSGNPTNKKIHKLTKFSRINSEKAHSSSPLLLVSHSPTWHKKFLITTTTVLFLILGTLLFIIYFFTSSRSFAPLAPLIPEIVRGY